MSNLFSKTCWQGHLKIFNRLKNGNCKQCRYETKKKYRNSTKGKLTRTRYSTSLEARYSQLIWSARTRQIPLCLTFDDFIAKTNLNFCYYCEDKIGKTKGSGLDRIDSSEGYTINNTVLCCKICNKMKGILKQQDFYNQIRKINSVLMEKINVE